MATNFERINIISPPVSRRVVIAAPAINSGSVQIAQALDVDMTQKQDGSLLAWNGGSHKFEAKNVLRNQTVDGGNF